MKTSVYLPFSCSAFLAMLAVLPVLAQDPTVTIQATDPQAAEALSDPGTFTIRRTGSTNFSLLVFYQLSGTASNGVDYEQLGGTVQIPAGALAASFHVKPIDDSEVEGTESVIAHIVASPMMCMTCGYQIGTPNTADVFIYDNDAPGAVNIYATDPLATEHSPLSDIPPDTATFRVRRTGDTGMGIVVHYEISGTASNGVDYQKLSGEVTIPAGGASADIIVDPIYDTISEGTETVVLTLLAPCPPCLFANPPCMIAQGTNCYPIGPDNRAVAYIRDSETTGTNNSPSVQLITPRDGDVFASPADVQLVAFAQDTEDHYYPLTVEFFEGSRSLGFGTFVPGRCVTCPNYVLGWSNVPPGQYTLTAKVTDTAGASAVSKAIAVKVIEGNPPPTIVNIVARDAFASEGTNFWRGTTSPTWDLWHVNVGGTNSATFVVHRDGPTNSDLTVNYEIGGTASNGADYAALSGSATIPAGGRSAQIVVVPIDDTIAEAIETVVLKLKPSPDYTIGFSSHAAAIILDNDYPRPPCLMLSDGEFHLCRPAANGFSYRVEASSDLLHWTSLCTNVVTDGALHFVDPDSPPLSTRFYRVQPESTLRPDD